MITVKAFEKGLVCKGFKFEVGQTYYIPVHEVKLHKKGFHASAHCDLSETLHYYPNLPISKTEYCLVDIKVVDRNHRIVVGNKIKILKKLEDLDELIKYDRTGRWCYWYAYTTNDIDVKKLETAIIQKDKTGNLCYVFARYIQGADIPKLQSAVIQKDRTGKFCCLFAIHVKGADSKKLQDIVIQKDRSGQWCYRFAKDVGCANIELLENEITKKDKTGKYCYLLIKNVQGVNVKKLQEAVIEKDKFGRYCYLLAKNVQASDTEKLVNSVIQKDRKGTYCYGIIRNRIKGLNIKQLKEAMDFKAKVKSAILDIYRIEGHIYFAQHKVSSAKDLQNFTDRIAKIADLFFKSVDKRVKVFFIGDVPIGPVTKKRLLNCDGLKIKRDGTVEKVYISGKYYCYSVDNIMIEKNPDALYDKSYDWSRFNSYEQILSKISDKDGCISCKAAAIIRDLALEKDKLIVV